MELEYFTDEINLNDMQESEVEYPVIDELAGKLQVLYKRMHINPKDKKIFYKRNAQGKSVIGIQLGNEDDLSNYLLFDCSVESIDSKMFCNISFHADQRFSVLASQMVGLMSSEVISSFESLEYFINSDPREPKEVSIMKPIRKKNNTLQRLFGKKQNFQ